MKQKLKKIKITGFTPRVKLRRPLFFQPKYKSSGGVNNGPLYYVDCKKLGGETFINCGSSLKELRANIQGQVAMLWRITEHKDSDLSHGYIELKFKLLRLVK